MRAGRIIARVTVFVLTAIGLLTFQLANSVLLNGSNAFAQDDFPTLPPNEVTFTPAVEDGTPAPTPMSTLEAKEFFEEDDEDRPQYESIEEGDRWFGYGEVEGDPDSYLMWYTDKNGTHYRVVSSDSKVLFGTIDPATGERRSNGYDQLISDRDSMIDELHDLGLEISGEANSRDGSFLASGIVIGGGLVACIIFTGGVCGIVAAIAAPAGLTFAGVGVGKGIDHSNLLDKKDALLEEIQEQEDRIEDRFDRPES